MLPLLAAGMVVSAGSSLMAGYAAGNAADKQATAQRMAAVRRRLKASADARDIEDQGGRFAAKQAAGFAKSGVAIDSGSPLAVLMDTAIHVERNARRTRIQGDWDASSLESGAEASMAAGQSARWAGMAGAVGSFITGATLSQGAYKPSGGPT